MSWSPQVFNNDKHVLDSLFKVQMAPSQTPIVWGAENDGAREMSIEVAFG